MSKPVLTIGSDPEFMLSRAQSGEIISAIPVVGGGKYNRIDLGEGYLFYYDNTMLETCVPAADAKAKFLANIKETYARIASVLGQNYQILAVPSHSFRADECEHPDAKEAGCNPEFCAYELKQCLPPDFVDTFRSAGGHIHIGRNDFRAIDPEECSDDEFLIGSNGKIQMIKAMDIFVGLPLVLIDNSSASKERKRLYGKAGRFRPTSYGVEYRTPSNHWLSSPALAELIYDLTQAAFDTVYSGDIHFGGATDAAFEIINSDNAQAANEMLKTYLQPELYARVSTIATYQPKPIYEEWAVK